MCGRHSRTIAGVEKRIDGSVNLLMVDPLRSFSNQIRACEARRAGMGPMMNRVRVGLKNLSAPQYQIVHMPETRMTIRSAAEYDRSKAVVNVRVRASGTAY